MTVAGLGSLWLFSLIGLFIGDLAKNSQSALLQIFLFLAGLASRL